MGRKRELTDSEGSLLALIHLKGPITAYQIAKDYETSPLFTFNTAKGKLYPLLDRLTERGLLGSQLVPHDGRGTKLYQCTAVGRSDLAMWVKSFPKEHELPPDPFRRKLLALELLSRAEQLVWLEAARTQVERRLRAVEACDADEAGPFGRFAWDNAREALRGRLDWLERLEAGIRARRISAKQSSKK